VHFSIAIGEISSFQLKKSQTRDIYDILGLYSSNTLTVLGATTFSITTLNIMGFLATLSKMVLSILVLMSFFIMLSVAIILMSL
jgi:hypothetical protein